MKKMNDTTLKLVLTSAATLVNEKGREYAVSLDGSIAVDGRIEYHKVWINPTLWDLIVTGNEISAADLVEVTGELAIPEKGEDHYDERSRVYGGEEYRWEGGKMDVNDASMFTKWEARAKTGVFAMPRLKVAAELPHVNTSKPKNGGNPSKKGSEAAELK